MTTPTPNVQESGQHTIDSERVRLYVNQDRDPEHIVQSKDKVLGVTNALAAES
jgi:hypothetical protein